MSVTDNTKTSIDSYSCTHNYTGGTRNTAFFLLVATKIKIHCKRNIVIGYTVMQNDETTTYKTRESTCGVETYLVCVV
jgi:hypothetical protein